MQIQAKVYCLPSNLKTGIRGAAAVRDGSFPNGLDYAVVGSEGWAASVTRLQYASIDLIDTVGKNNILVASSSSFVRLVNNQEESYTLIEAIPSTQSAVEITDLHTIEEVFTFAKATVFSGERTSTNEVCIKITLDTQLFATLPALKTRAYGFRFCSDDQNVFSTIGTPYVTCLGPSCSGVALFPASDGYPVKVCNRPLNADNLECYVVESDAKLATNLGLNTEQNLPMSLTQDNVAIRELPRLAQNSLTGYNGYREQSSLTIFSIGNQRVTTTWIADIRLIIEEGVWRGARKYSTVYQTYTTIRKTCNVTDCTGCMGYPTLQRLCYSASQCAVARCIGTTVNFQRPLCAMGSVVMRDLLQQLLINTQTVWIILTQTIKLVVDASSGQIRSRVLIEWPDTVFFSMMCETKDIVVSAIGLIASLINTITIKSQEILSSEAVALVPFDPSFNARSTLAMASITNMFSQLVFFPLYMSIASQKIFTCTANSLLAVVNLDTTGNFQIIIGSPEVQAASADVVGVCLTQVFNEDLQSNTMGSTVSGAVTQVANRLIDFGFTIQLSPMYHVTDATLSYAVGVTYGFMDVLQTLDEKHCKLPDITATTISKCACGDYAHRIATERRQQGIRDHAFWCTGVMQILRSDGKPRLVFNPYTLQELLDASVGKMDRYLNCIGTQTRFGNCDQYRPKLPILEQQGVDVGTKGLV